MPNIKFGRKLIISPTKDDVEVDDIEVVEHIKVQDASPKVFIKEDEEERKFSLTYKQSRKKIRNVEQVVFKNEDSDDKLVEVKVTEYLERLKKQMMDAMSQREEKVIKIIKMKDIQLSKMKFNQESQALEWAEQAELFKKEATVNEEIINELEKENEELTKERDHREESLMKLRDQVHQLSLENEKLKQKSDQIDSLRAEVEAIVEEREKQAEKLQTLQTELETSQQQLKDKAEENKQILQDSAWNAEKNSKKLNEELKEKEALLEDWRRKAGEKDRELSMVQEQRQTEKENYIKDLERKDRIHKKELKSRVEQSNKTIEKLRKQLEKPCKQVGLREEVPTTKEKVLTDHEPAEGLKNDSNLKQMEGAVKENQHEVENQTPIGNPRDPRIRNKGQSRRTSDEAKNFGNFELKTNDSFFCPQGVGEPTFKYDNPFDQRPFHVKRKEYERNAERKKEFIRKMPSDKWKYEPRYNNHHYHRQEYYRTWSH